MALNLVVLGPPGAGKGTQAEQVARGRGIVKISTGDILREAVQAGSEIGRRVKAITNRGELVSDDVVIEIVRERLDRQDARAGFVLDGFPRTVAQAAALDRMMNGRDPLIVIEIAVPEADLVRRLGARLVCQDCGANAAGAESMAMEADQAVLSGASAGGAAVGARTGAGTCQRCGGRLSRRSDDSEAVVRQRLKVHRRDSQPLVDYYRTRPTFRSIDGAQSPDRVAWALAAAIEAVGGGTSAGPRGPGGAAQ